MQGRNRKLHVACTQKNSTTNICFSLSLVLILIVALFLDFRMKVKELFLLYIFSPMACTISPCMVGISKGLSNCIGG